VLAADRPAALYLSCPSGVESLLAIEARRILGAAAQITESRGGIEVIAPTTASAAERQHTLRDYAMRLNLESRLAQRVLWRVASRVYRHEDDIYVMARGVNWSDWITPQHTLRVDVVSRRSHLQSLNFAGLRVKDAVCDDLRERTGERPSVDRGAERLVPGQALEIVLAGNGSAGLQVPSAAIIRYESQTLVFIEKDGPDQKTRYQPRPVRIVQQGGDSALIEGVRPGERIVVSGSAALKAMLAGVGKS